MEGEHTTIPISFFFEAGVPPSQADKNDGLSFWQSPTTIEWFKNRGFTFYKHYQEFGASGPSLPFTSCHEAQYPWPYINVMKSDSDDGEGTSIEPPWAENSPGKVVFAQDASNRHVVIKVVRDNTDEYRALRFLHEQSMETLQENCVMPVLDLLPNGDYWFAVMPRWGMDVYFPPSECLYEVVDIIHCMIKGLAFLHENNIAHGDIGFHNFAVNQFADVNYAYNDDMRKELRLDRRLSYALFDFDFCTVLPPNTNKSQFRLWYERSHGTFNLSGDTAAGEYEYDPFAFDVGALGVNLHRQFHYIVPSFPALAALFDMMTNWDIPRRFTATQALQFLESQLVPELDLGQWIFFKPFEGVDVWETLSDQDVERWKAYKTLPLPWSHRLLRWMTDKDYLFHIVPWTRWLCFQAFSVFPRRVCFEGFSVFPRWVLPIFSPSKIFF